MEKNRITFEQAKAALKSAVEAHNAEESAPDLPEVSGGWLCQADVKEALGLQ